jgi:Replication-relaxation
MDAVAERPRARRYQRRVESPPFQLTARDLRILAHVARHRFLSSEQLAALDGGSRQNLLRCLRVLFDHGYLDRPYAQLAHLPLTGPRPMVYGLGRRGAQALAEHRGAAATDTDWTERNKRAGALFIEHTLAVAGFMVGMELACRKDSKLGLLREADILAEAPAKTRAAREPLRLSVQGLDNKLGVSSVVADGLFGLAFPDDTASYFLLEMDRGSMPVKRSRFDKTSFQRKLKVYWEAWKVRRHVEHFGVKQIRVLTVTESAERVDHMISAVYEITGGRGSNFFLFAEKSRFYGRLPTEVWWTTGRGELARLTD